MSELRVNAIVNAAGTGAPEFSKGCEFPVGHAELSGNVSVTGVATATSFSGSGANLTGIAVTAYVDSVNITASGIVTVTNTTASTSTTSGALIVSGGVGVAGSVFIGENLSIGGTVTYEDVRNVDSIGIVTARAGVIVTGNLDTDTLNVSGLSTFAGLVDINGGGQANTFKVEDLTAGRVVLAGTGGEIEDSGNLTFNGTK